MKNVTTKKAFDNKENFRQQRKWMNWHKENEWQQRKRVTTYRSSAVSHPDTIFSWLARFHFFCKEKEKWDKTCSRKLLQQNCRQLKIAVDLRAEIQRNLPPLVWSTLGPPVQMQSAPGPPDCTGLQPPVRVQWPADWVRAGALSPIHNVCVLLISHHWILSSLNFHTVRCNSYQMQ